MVGLMRYQVPYELNISSGISSKKIQHQNRSTCRMPLVLLCLAVGFALGRWTSSTEFERYPLEEEAFLPPPDTVQLPVRQGSEQQQQQQDDSKVSNLADQSSHISSNNIHQQQQQQSLELVQPSSNHTSIMAESKSLNPDTFTEDCVQQSGLLRRRPPVTPGISGNNHYTLIPYQILSWYPRIVLYPNFLDQADTQHIIDLAHNKLKPSKIGGSEAVAAQQQGVAVDPAEVRTSAGVFLSCSADTAGVLARIENKISAATLIPPSHGEDFNVLQYKTGQHYDNHMDTFNPLYLRQMGPEFGQRLASFIMYLSDVKDGGETVFKQEGKYGAATSFNSKRQGLVTCEESNFKYKPRRGDALLFYNLNPDLSINPRALHGACPVKGGSDKWVMTKWLHDKPIAQFDTEAAD